jgi:hypothetical protein
LKAKGRRKAEGLKAKGWRQGRRGRSMPILEGEKQIRVEGREGGPRQWGPWAPNIAS